MNTLIIYAHPEPKSFNGAMKDLAVSTLSELGHNVEVTDLYAQKFNPVISTADVKVRKDPDFFEFASEAGNAFREGQLADDIAAEQAKVQRADFLIFQFPYWWWSMPAILKGWIDRVFTRGFGYGGGDWYDTGKLVGRRAMLSLTTGSSPAECSDDGLFGDIHERLYQIQHGSLYFVGIQVVPPFIAWGIQSADAGARVACLERYKDRLSALETLPAIPFVSPEDIGDDGKLKPGVTRQIKVDGFD